LTNGTFYDIIVLSNRKGDNNMKVGDKVLVVDAEQLYTIYSRFFEEEEIENSNWKIRYAFGNANIDTDVTYKILYIDDNGDKALITERIEDIYGKYYPIYLINTKGLVLKDYEKAEEYFNRLNNVMSEIKAIRYNSSFSNEPRYKVEFSNTEAYSVEVDFGLMFSHIIRH
jgi:hypothetical protein